MTTVRPLVAGNWKMNGVAESLGEVDSLLDRLMAGARLDLDIMICPPATLIRLMAERLDTVPIAVGGQDCHMEASGAYTGDVSAEMLADAGAAAVIVGHSERRSDHGENDTMVKAKAQAAHRAGLTAIICLGETEEQRRAGATLDVVSEQLAGSLPEAASASDTIIAYEPVWAIGTGLTPTEADVAEVHGAIRSQLSELLAGGEGAGARILYGGSVKPDNAAALMAIDHVNGALVGGASLKADDFYGILEVYGAK